MKTHRTLPALGLLTSLLLAACGGSDDASAPTTRAPLLPLAEETVPAGERLDLRARNYFVNPPNATWIYDRIEGSATEPRAVTRRISGGYTFTGDFTVTTTYAGQIQSDSYRYTTDGILRTDPLAGLAPRVARDVAANVMEYPEPFYPVGGTRTVVRQGDWGADVDGDGIYETFRYELSQQVVGYETLTIPQGSVDTVHFRTVTRLTLSPSSLATAVSTTLYSEDSWWGSGYGLVRAERITRDAGGAVVMPAYTLMLNELFIPGLSSITAPAP